MGIGGHFQTHMFRELILQFRAKLVLTINVCLLYLRDGMNVSYPKYFVVCGSVMLGSISLLNYGVLTFSKWNSVYPKWLSVPATQAFCQVMIISYLSLYRMCCRDRENQYFVLIRRRKKT